jgi:hypothetical protein
LNSANEVCFSVVRETYAVSCDDPAIYRELCNWSLLLRSSPQPGQRMNRFALRAHAPGGPTLEAGARTVVCEDPTDLLPELLRIVYEHLLGPEHGLAVIHAAVLARGRRCFLFTGDSGVGKSILSLDLSSRGWTYMSDDIALVDADGRVHAFPRPVQFDASEIEPALWQRVARDRLTWSARWRAPSGSPRTLHFVIPRPAAASDEAFEVGAVFRLEKRPGGRPRMRRLAGAAARAWLFAHHELARRDARPSLHG